MSMTKKDYELLANWVNDNTYTLLIRDEFTGEKKDDEITFSRDAVKQLAATLHNDNPKFDCDRFLAACGVTS